MSIALTDDIIKLLNAYKYINFVDSNVYLSYEGLHSVNQIATLCVRTKKDNCIYHPISFNNRVFNKI